MIDRGIGKQIFQTLILLLKCLVSVVCRHRRTLDTSIIVLDFLLQAEGLTAIECWVIACIIFVFGALLEYTVILLKLKIR